ncbi:MAG TPA: hypothetical protein PLH37_00615 [bacterium]|nr:hypothetical protein [bacterium]
MKKSIFVFLFLFWLLSSLAFGQEFQPTVFGPENFLVPTQDTPIAGIGEKLLYLPTNLPRVVSEGNDWWNVGDEYIPRGWAIPNHNLGIGPWFGWYLHRADLSLNRSAAEQIAALPVPEPVKKIFLEQKISAGIRTDLLKTGTLVSAMTFVSGGKLVAPTNCIWLGKEDLNIHLYPQYKFAGWVYQLGFVFDCNNHFFFKWKLQEKEVTTQLAPPPPVTTAVVDTTPNVVVTAEPPTTATQSSWKPQLRSWGYAGLGGNRVAREFGINYTWQYAGVDVEFLPVHWFGLIAKSAWAHSTDNFWGQKNQVWRPMVGLEILHPRFVIRSLYGRDFQNGEFLRHNVWEEGLEVYPWQRTILALTGVYINKPGDQWDYLWSRAQGKYAVSVSNNNTRKLWLGGQASWMGTPGWERELKGQKQRPEEYTTRLEALGELEFGQRRNLVFQVTAGVGSKSVGYCGSATLIIRIL